MSWFSAHAHPIEKDFNRFLRSLNASSNRLVVQQRLTQFMQQDLVIVTLWLERRFKNYRNLHKWTRQRLYRQTQQLVAAFDQFASNYQPETIQLQVAQQHFAQQPNQTNDWLERMQYLFAIMAWLRPGKHYQYQNAASFSKLLQDPAKQPLIGDCNQIVTLYVYLYSRKFPITDLQIKLLPEHVCLHFRGLDIEATAGTLANYEKYEYIAEISELPAVNLLDISDQTITTAPISSQSLLQSARLAFALSSQRKLVEQNLRSAYHRLINAALKANNHQRALEYGKKLGDQQLLLTIRQHQAAYAYNNQRWQLARQLYKTLQDTRMVQACYQQEFNAALKAMPAVRTTADVKKYRTRYKKLLILATKAGLTEQASQIKKMIS